MTIQLNDETRETGAATITALLEELNLAGQPVLIERNGIAHFPREFDTTKLAEGDKLELIRVVAGG